MASDIQIIAIDASGPHLVRLLKAASGFGAIVQVVNSALDSRLNRTWHKTSSVHDTTAARELWAREDLRAGALTGFKQIGNVPPTAFVIDLRSDRPSQVFEGWYAHPADVTHLTAEIQARAKSDTIHQYQDFDAHRTRLLFAFVPLGA